MESLKEILTDALRYWEPRRLVYNIVLAAIVIVVFVMGLPASKALSWPSFGNLLILTIPVAFPSVIEPLLQVSSL